MITIKPIAAVEKPKTKNGMDYPIGTTFTGKQSGNYGLFLRTYHGIVDLNNPTQTWSGTPQFMVYEFKEVDLEIHVTEK